MTNFKFGDIFGTIKLSAIEDKYMKEVDTETFIKKFDIGKKLVDCKSLNDLLEIVSEYSEETAKIVVGSSYVIILFDDFDITYNLNKLEISMERD